jgi:hypothetical protein
VPRSMQGLQPHVLAYVPLRGRPVQAQLGIAHRSRENSAAVLKFIELARSTARTKTVDSLKRSAPAIGNSR